MPVSRACSERSWGSSSHKTRQLTNLLLVLCKVARRHGSYGSSHSKGCFLSWRGCRQNSLDHPTTVGGNSRRASSGSGQHAPCSAHTAQALRRGQIINSATTGNLDFPQSLQIPWEKPRCFLPTHFSPRPALLENPILLLHSTEQRFDSSWKKMF